MKSHHDAGLIYTMEYRVTAIAEQFKPENIVMLLHALVTMEVKPDAGDGHTERERER